MFRGKLLVGSMKHGPRVLVWALLALVFLPTLLPAGTFPYRDNLAAEVGFWKQVFVRYHQNDYLIHDARFPWLVYAVVHCDTTLSQRSCERYLKGERRRWQSRLRALALKLHRGDTLQLDSLERRVLAQFRQLKFNYSLRRAARNVRIQQGIRERFVEGVRRSYRYLPYIRQVFREAGLPEALVYLPHMESSFNEKAISHAGAAGMWQFMRATARLFMKINRVVDQRFDPFVSTRAAARLLAYNYAQLQDWALAITAYNHGLAGMKRAVRRYGRDYLKIRENYLRRSFGFASRNFYPEFLAIVELMDSLSIYFPDLEPQPPLQFVEITLAAPVRLPHLIRALALDRTKLRALNPAFRTAVWRGWRAIPAGYRIRLPAGTDLLAVDRWLSGTNAALARNAPSPQGKSEALPPAHHATVPQAAPVIHPEPIFAGLKPAVEEVLQNQPVERFLQPVASLAALQPEGPRPGLAQGRAASSAGRAPVPTAVDLNDSAVPRPAPERWHATERASAQDQTVSLSRPVVLNQLLLHLRRQLEPRNNRIVVFPEETPGHIAEWLNLPTYRIRQLNGLTRRQPIYAGQILRVDFSRVSPQEFLRRRLQFHLQLLSSVLDFHRPIYLTTHVVQPGESLWSIAEQIHKIPVNILLYFNPVDKLNQLRPGDVIQLPAMLDS
ncbi:MAG: LysM peptidoglycan-binding domain-containing protein [Calditrichaeota bacterium]|nr:MAG: LysM peptidoglycan-binding domain-containing protein [Calditrichota bacterium]